jgi:hypothetical protein
MAIGNGVVIRFLADTGSAVRDITRLERATGRSMGAMGKASTVWSKTVGPALAGAAAAAGAFAVKFGVDGVQAFIADDAAAKKLAKTLQNLGRAQDTAQVEAYIDALSRATGVADDQLRPAMEKLLIATKDTATAQSLLKTALDTATGAGVPLESVTSAIAKAVNGQYGAIKRLIPTFDDAAAKAGGLVNVQKQLDKAYGGQAAEKAGTYAGKIQSLATAYGELQESFGRGLVDGLDGSSDSMSEMNDTLYELGPAAEDLGRTLGDIATASAEALTYLGPLVDKFNELNDMGDGILTNGTLANAMKAVAGVRYLTGAVTGNEAARQAAWNDFYDGGLTQSANPYEQYRPMQTAQRTRDAVERADARSGQTGARTRARP